MKKLKLFLPIAITLITLLGCSFPGKTEDPMSNGSIDLFGEQPTSSEEGFNTDPTSYSDDMEIIAYTLENGKPTVTYSIGSEMKSLAVDIYYEKEWLDMDGYTLGDTDCDGLMDDDYLVCDIDDDGKNELLVGTIVWGNNTASDFCTYTLYELDENNDLVKSPNPICQDIYGCNPRVENGRMVVTKYVYNGYEKVAVDTRIGYIEGDFVDDEYFPNFVRIVWDDYYTKATVLVSVYRQMGYSGVGYMDNGTVKMDLIADDGEGSEDKAIFYRGDNGYELMFTQASYIGIRDNEPYEGFYESIPEPEETITSRINVNVYSNKIYERDGAIVLVGTVSETFGEYCQYTEGDEIDMYFDDDTILDNPDMLDQCEAGDTATSWLRRLSQDEYSVGVEGVYDIYMTDGHVDEVVGLYWWD